MEDYSNKITWDAQTIGKNGGYVDPSTLTYTLMVYIRSEQKFMTIARGVEDLFYYDDLGGAETQEEVYYYVRAVDSRNANGEYGMSNPLAIGDPYYTPFTESFANGRLQSEPWSVYSLNGTGGWAMFRDGSYGVNSYDDDNGGVMYIVHDAGDSGILYSPIISAEFTSNPILRFYYYNDASGNELIFHISTDGYEYNPVKTIVLSENTGWTEGYVSLNDYKENIGIQFGVLAKANTASHIFLDQFSLLDDQTGVRELQNENIPVVTTGAGIMSVTNIIKETVQVSPPAGICLFNTKATSSLNIPVTPGFYIVKTGSYTTKVVVKE